MTGMDGSLPYFYRRDGMGWIGVVDGLLVLVWIRGPREKKKVIIIMVLLLESQKSQREADVSPRCYGIAGGIQSTIRESVSI